MRNPTPGLASNHALSSLTLLCSWQELRQCSLWTSLDHSKYASESSLPAIPRALICASCDDASPMPALAVYQTCGFFRADIVGNRAAIEVDPKIIASSMIRQSHEKPRPEPLVRARKRSLAPFSSSMDSDPCATVIRRTLRRRSSVFSTRDLIRPNASRLVLNSWLVWTI